jgi:glycosyltransferase involved in cell wall biosynthesis
VTGARLAVSLDVTAVPPDPRGAGRYTVELARALGRRQDLDLTLVSRSADARRWSTWAPSASVLASAPGPRPLRLAWEQLSLPRLLDGQALDVHHGPHYTMPERSRLPKVVTIHDLTFFDHPEWHERSKVPFFRRAIRRAVRKASVLVCVSQPTARRLQELLDPRCPVVVAPHGVDPARFRPAEAGEVSQDEDRALLDQAGVPESYVAFLGTIEPRKGVDLLVRAFDRLAGDQPGLHLVIAGGRGWGGGGAEEAMSAMAHRDRLVRPGYLGPEAVPALLRRARLVVYPARVEGFGLPVLEAMACGAPVVTTAGSVMEELAGGMALTFPPEDFLALAETMDRILRDPPTAPQRSAAVEVARGYTWERSAEAHLRAYRLAVGGGR